MSSLLNLPESLLFTIFDEWLPTWRDVLALDSAVCCKLYRPHFLDAVKHGLLRSKWTPMSTLPFQYAINRRIQVANVKIRMTSNMHLVGSCISNRHLKGLEFQLNEKFDLSFVGDMIFRCPGLEILTIQKLGTFRSDRFLSDLPGDRKEGLFALQKLHLSQVEAMRDDDLCFLCVMAPNLQELIVLNCASVTGNGIFTSIKHLSRLHTLRTARMDATIYIPYDPQQSDASDYRWNGNLRTLLINEVIAPREYIFTLIQNNPLLEHLDVMYLERGQGQDVLKVLEVLPSLQRLFIGGVLLNEAFFHGLTLSSKACMTLQKMTAFTVMKATRQANLRCEVGHMPDAWRHFLSNCHNMSHLNIQLIFDDASLSALFEHFIMTKTLRYFVIKNAFQVSDEAFKPLLTQAAEPWLNMKGQGHVKIVMSEVPGLTRAMMESLKKAGVKIIA